MYQHYLGVDLHRRRTYVVLMDKEGEVCDQRRLPNDAMSDYVAQLPEDTFAVLEATATGAICTTCSRKGHPKWCWRIPSG